MSIFQPTVMFISAVLAIAFALISIGWFFRDGDESTRSLQEFASGRSGVEWWTTKLGLWLSISCGAGYLCYPALSAAGRWLHLAP
jgi:hypothetical protein